MPTTRKNSKTQVITAETKRSWNHWYQRPRNLIIAVIALILIGAIAWSVYYFQARPYNQVVIKYNGKQFNMRYFVDSLKAYYGQSPVEVAVADYADWVEQQIEQNENIIQGSLALGVSIPRSNVSSELARVGRPTTQASIDIQMARDLIARQVPASQPQYNIKAMLVESEARAQLAIARLQTGESFLDVSSNFTSFASATQTTGVMEWVTPRQAELNLGSTKFAGLVSDASLGAVSGPVFDHSVIKGFGYWVAQVVEISYDTDNITPIAFNVKGILLANLQDAEDALNKLKAGTDLDELAAQVSLADGAQDNGAGLGWLTQAMDANLFNGLTNIPLNSISGVIEDNTVETPGGYWVYIVTEKDENKELNSYQQQLLEGDLTQKCAAALTKNPGFKVENLLTQEQKDAAINEAVRAQGAGSVLIGVSTLPDAELGLEYYFKLKVFGEQKGNTWTLTDGVLPDGLHFDAINGVISGIPTVAGGGGITVKVENSIHYHTQELNYHVRMPVTITTSALPDGKVGESYYGMLEAFSDAQSYTWSIVEGKLPDGLALDKTSGTISGKPTTAGTFSFTVQADDGLRKDAKALTIKIE
jgi:parvulin-like peptidyl-prolyl isomerase